MFRREPSADLVTRVLSVNGLDRLIPIYPSVEAAMAAATPAAAVPIVPKHDSGPR